MKLGGELDEVEVKLLGRLVQAVLVDGLDALRGQPKPHEPLTLLPVELAPLQVQVLHLLSCVKRATREGTNTIRRRTTARLSANTMDHQLF